MVLGRYYFFGLALSRVETINLICTAEHSMGLSINRVSLLCVSISDIKRNRIDCTENVLPRFFSNSFGYIPNVVTVSGFPQVR